MAWNEPGKPGQDPWGNNKPPRKEGTSPDPAQQVRRQLEKFMDRLGDQSGGGQDRDGNGASPEGLGVGLGVLAALAGAVWLGFGIYIVDPAERGVVTVFGKFSEETSSGPHWNWPSPIGDVVKINVEQIRNAEIGYRTVKTGASDVNAESLMLTQDENIVDVN